MCMTHSKQPTLGEHAAQVGDAFVDECWEPVLGTKRATFTVTKVVPHSGGADYEIQFVEGALTWCSHEARGRKL